MAASPNGKQEDSFFAFLALEIVKDFPDLTMEELDRAMLKGIKGDYNTEAFIVVNSFTIYKWIKSILKERKPKQMSPEEIENLWGERKKV